MDTTAYLLKLTSSYLFKKAMDAAIETAKSKLVGKTLKENVAKVEFSPADIEQSIQHHLTFVENWSQEVSFNDLRKPRLISDIFVPIDISVFPKRMRVGPAEKIKNVPLKRIFEHDPHHIILLGQPGAGKTTSIKFICQGMLHNEKRYANEYSFPLLIRVRDLNGLDASPDSTLLLDRIMNTLGVRLQFQPLPARFAESSPRLMSSIVAERRELISSVLAERRAIRERVVSGVLNELQLLLIIEGFDELISLANRQQTIQDIGTLALNLDRARLLVTSRTGDFAYNVDRTVQYEVAPLTTKQIATFATKWLKNKNKSARFLESIEVSPFKDTAIRPLTLAHLCAIYERVGAIPEKPKSVYYKIIYLLLEEWDQQRAILRQSRYASFDVRRKFEFLCEIAYHLTVSLHKSIFDKTDLLHAYQSIHRDFGLPAGEADQVASELETHTGLLVKTGYQDFEFAHKSIQEYLAAEYLVRLPSIPPSRVLYTIPNELAIAITLSSKSTEYFNEVVFGRIVDKGIPEDFMSSFLNRLLAEKPDFNIDIHFGLSVLVLWSTFRKNRLNLHAVISNRDDREQPWVFGDQVWRDLERLMSMALTRSSLEAVQIHYQRVSSERGVAQLRRRLVKPSDALPHLPDFLYVDEKFLQKVSPTSGTAKRPNK